MWKRIQNWLRAYRWNKNEFAIKTSPLIQLASLFRGLRQRQTGLPTTEILKRLQRPQRKYQLHSSYDATIKQAQSKNPANDSNTKNFLQSQSKTMGDLSTRISGAIPPANEPHNPAE